MDKLSLIFGELGPQFNLYPLQLSYNSFLTCEEKSLIMLLTVVLRAVKNTKAKTQHTLVDLKKGLGESGSWSGFSSKEEKNRIGLQRIFGTFQALVFVVVCGFLRDPRHQLTQTKVFFQILCWSNIMNSTFRLVEIQASELNQVIKTSAKVWLATKFFIVWESCNILACVKLNSIIKTDELIRRAKEIIGRKKEPQEIYISWNLELIFSLRDGKLKRFFHCKNIFYSSPNNKKAHETTYTKIYIHMFITTPRREAMGEDCHAVTTTLTCSVACAIATLDCSIAPATLTCSIAPAPLTCSIALAPLTCSIAPAMLTCSVAPAMLAFCIADLLATLTCSKVAA
ncbi:hypothetical protein VP01_4732g1 [Puccinia sorghi]|uniref:Uncharacterized protein n=1 Tax=Puccinia sorghi TaxID=27349 RepID=A0A0L6UMX8_9BASI|nr:hypothetical protein VP01_4732g1 [Puccinia sorghi]